ncbi:unnamed protein product [Rhizophagus irregularis]|nr:unnamed protein product [Rhizophagus irregularis]
MPRFSILKTRTRSSVRNLGVEKVQYCESGTGFFGGGCIPSHVSEEDAPAEERTDEVVCAEEEYLTSLGVLDEDVDIKIFWGGGKTDGII